MDPRIVAAQIWSAHYRRKASHREPNTAEYLSYDAPIAKHSAIVQGVEQSIDLNLANRGLSSGDKIELVNGIADAQPRVRRQPRRSDVQPIEEPFLYASIVWRWRSGINTSSSRVVEGSTPFGDLFILRTGYPPFKIPNNVLTETLPQVRASSALFSARTGYITWDELGRLHVDIYLWQDFAAGLVYPQHFRLDGNTLTRVPRSATWRGVAVENTVLLDAGQEYRLTSNDVYGGDDRLIPEPVYAGKPIDTVHLQTNRLFRLKDGQVYQYDLTVPYDAETMASLIPETFNGSPFRIQYIRTIHVSNYDGGIVAEEQGISFSYTRIRILPNLVDQGGALVFAPDFTGDPPDIPWGNFVRSTPMTIPPVPTAALDQLAEPENPVPTAYLQFGASAITL